MKTIEKAQVHLFGDMVALWNGSGETVYMTGEQARGIAGALLRASRSVATGEPCGTFTLKSAAEEPAPPEPLLPYPLRAFLDLSTAHLSRETMDWLDRLDWPTEGPSGGATGFGYFVHVQAERSCPMGVGTAELPADLWACMERARAMGADYVLFDCDADPNPDLLPVYEHA